MKITLFYIITSGENESRRLGEKAIQARLAACANILPSHSLFNWDQELKDELESVLLLKTIPDQTEKLSAFIQTLHSYEVPCILHWDVEASAPYGEWVKKEVTEHG